MAKEKKSFGRRMVINFIMTIGLFIVVFFLPVLFLVIAGDIYFSDMFNILDNLQTIADYGLAMGIGYVAFLIAFGVCCFSIYGIRTLWTVWLGILSLLQAAWVIVLTILTVF